jgi:hypothetical protein
MKGKLAEYEGQIQALRSQLDEARRMHDSSRLRIQDQDHALRQRGRSVRALACQRLLLVPACVCVCVCVCARARMRAFVRACVRKFDWHGGQ